MLKMKQRLNGPLSILIGALFWSFGGVLGKLIPWNGLSIAAVRGLIAALTIGLYRQSFKVQLTKPVILAAFSLTFTTLLYMVANKLTSAANAIVLQYTSPIFIILFAYVFDHKLPKKRDVFALVGVMLGISLFFIQQLKGGNILGDLIALASGLTFAGVFFANRLPHANPMDANYLGNVMSLALLPFIFLDPNFHFNPSLSWILIAIMGIFQLGFGYIFFSIGIKHTSATTASILATLEPILNPIWVFLVIGEMPDPLALAGGLIVLLTVLIYNYQVTQDNYAKK